jgi:hypothetical protein
MMAIFENGMTFQLPTAYSRVLSKLPSTDTYMQYLRTGNQAETTVIIPASNSLQNPCRKGMKWK